MSSFREIRKRALAGAIAVAIATEIVSRKVASLPTLIETGSLLIATWLALYAIEPWLRSHPFRTVGRLAFLPIALQEWWMFYLYRPHVEIGEDITTHSGIGINTIRHGIFIIFDVETIFPYGETTIHIDKSRLRVKQGKRTYNFIPKSERPIIRIGAPEKHRFNIDFILEAEINEKSGFKEDHEFY